MTDFASEFSKIFSNGCDVSNTDWTAPRYFDATNNPCYEAEAALASSLTSEAYSQSGFEVQYFIKKIGTKEDKLYGEDQLENFERRFRLQVYTSSVPMLQKMYQLQGMVYTEIITLQATIAHFEEASQIDFVTGESSWESQVPRIGDVMYFPWCDLYYEVLNVKTFAEGTSFLSAPITYTFSLRVWRNSKEFVDVTQNANDDKLEHLKSYVSLGETFGVTHSDGSEFEHITTPSYDTKPVELPSSKVKDNDVLSVNRSLEKVDNSHVLYDDTRNNDEVPDFFAGW